jgi:hypothetical protein
LQPTAPSTPTPDQAEEQFQPFERPSPEQEDQRGKPSKKGEDGESPAPEDEAMPDLPSELEGRVTPQQLPVIDEVVLQSPVARDVDLWQSAESIHTAYDVSGEPRRDRQLALSQQKLADEYEQISANMPQLLPETKPAEPLAPVTENRSDSTEEIPTHPLQDDAPPSLPASLRRISMGIRLLPTRKVRVNSGTTQPRTPSARSVVPASWQQSANIQSTGIGLINPAAAVSAGSEGDELKQAIYYEATESVQKGTADKR